MPQTTTPLPSERSCPWPLRRPRALVAALWLAACGALVPAALAERADRGKPLNVQADETGTVNLQSQTLVFKGNVVITKGTMIIRAARVEVRQLPTGYDVAVAYGGGPGSPATFRQKRDGVDEYIAGEADRLEYDGKADTIKFVNNAAVRRLRGAKLADEITGNLVTYDSTTEVFSVSGGAPATAANPGGRVQAVLTPREGSEAALEAASQSASDAPRAPVLRSSPRLADPGTPTGNSNPSAPANTLVTPPGALPTNTPASGSRR